MSLKQPFIRNYRHIVNHCIKQCNITNQLYTINHIHELYLTQHTQYNVQSQHHSIHTTTQQYQQTQQQLQSAYNLVPLPPPPKLPVATIPVYKRYKTGKYYSKYIKQYRDRIPGVIQYCGPDSPTKPVIRIEVDKYLWNEQVRRGGLHSRIFNIKIVNNNKTITNNNTDTDTDNNNNDSEIIQCVLNQTLYHPTTEAVQNLVFIRHDENLPVRIHLVPDFDGLDNCAGIKRGGEFHQIYWFVQAFYTGSAEHLPYKIYINMQDKNIGDKIVLGSADAPIPQGCKLYKAHHRYVLGKITGSDRYSNLDDDMDTNTTTATTTAAATATTAATKGGTPKAKESNKAQELAMAAAAAAKKAERR